MLRTDVAFPAGKVIGTNLAALRVINYLLYRAAVSALSMKISDHRQARLAPSRVAELC